MEEEIIVVPVVTEVSDNNDVVPEIKDKDSIPEDTEEKIEDGYLITECPKIF